MYYIRVFLNQPLIGPLHGIKLIFELECECGSGDSAVQFTAESPTLSIVLGAESISAMHFQRLAANWLNISYCI
jgi:hypothetical protein